MRETSRKDDLAATRLFFNNVAERRNATEVPVTSTVSVSQTDTPPVTSASVETERPEPETSNVRTIFQVDCPLDLLLQLPVGLGHGYKEYQKDK